MKLTPAKRKILEYLRDNPKARLVNIGHKHKLQDADGVRFRPVIWGIGFELAHSPWLERMKVEGNHNVSYCRFTPGAEITSEWYESAMEARRQKAATAQAEKANAELERRAASARKLDLFHYAFIPDENYVSERSGPTVLYVRLNENVYRVENANDD